VSAIHATAIVDASARVAEDVTIGPYSIVGPDVTVGAGCVLGPHVVIGARTRLGKRNRIFQFASIGEIPQDRKYGGEATTTTIGDDNTFREYATVHAGTAQDRGDTAIGNANLFPGYRLLDMPPGSERDRFAAEMERKWLNTTDPENAYYMAAVTAMAGYPDSTLRLLKRAVDGNYLMHESLDRDPVFESIRRIPEYAAIRAESIRRQKEFLAKRAP